MKNDQKEIMCILALFAFIIATVCASVCVGTISRPEYGAGTAAIMLLALAGGLLRKVLSA